MLKTDGDQCSQMMKIRPAKPHVKKAALIISKSFNVTIESKMNRRLAKLICKPSLESEYLAPIAIMVLILLVIFIVSTYYMRFEMFYDNSDSERFREFRGKKFPCIFNFLRNFRRYVSQRRATLP